MKKPPSHFKNIFESQRRKSIDPRFEDYTGEYNPKMAMKAYNFIPDVQKN